MKIEDLKNARLSESTQGYLAIYIKLDELLLDLPSVAEMIYPADMIDTITNQASGAIIKAREEVMKLASDSIECCICGINNHTKI